MKRAWDIALFPLLIAGLILWSVLCGVEYLWKSFWQEDFDGN
jgi:hypothetical protein